MSGDGDLDSGVGKVTSALAHALAASAQLSRYEPDRHEAQLVELLWQPILERDPAASVRSEATRASLSRAQPTRPSGYFGSKQSPPTDAAKASLASSG